MPLDCTPERAQSVPCPGDIGLWFDALCKMFPRGFAFDAVTEPGTLLYGRARVMADLLATFHAQACMLPREFNCDTQELTTDNWWADYGLPDACGITELCPKVTFIGNGRCESLLEIGASLGFDLCCEIIPTEIQPGGWNLGDEQMPPDVKWLGGGSELGFASLGHCPADLGGSALGVGVLGPDGADCDIVGYRELEDTEDPVEPPCAIDGCDRYWPPSSGEFDLCAAAWWHDYTGTAYHLKVGIQGSSAILNDPGYAEMGCMEMGCSQLCTPPVAELHCFIDQHVHSHIVAVPIYC